MVLEARYKAEKIEFPVVWEKEKDASNVIDYNINGEITKDISSVINANNETTTGMANVIPWVNAPKLIASTSIIWDIWWWGSKYMETTLWFNWTILEGEYESFNVFNITGDNFISVDPNSPSHLLIWPWNYMLYAHIDVRDGSLIFFAGCRYYWPDWTLKTRIFDVSGSKETLTQIAIFSVTENGWHIRIWIRPENWDANNFTNSVLRIMKLW
jgi:hypothetical protein